MTQVQRKKIDIYFIDPNVERKAKQVNSIRDPRKKGVALSQFISEMCVIIQIRNSDSIGNYTIKKIKNY